MFTWSILDYHFTHITLVSEFGKLISKSDFKFVPSIFFSPLFYLFAFFDSASERVSHVSFTVQIWICKSFMLSIINIKANSHFFLALFSYFSYICASDFISAWFFSMVACSFCKNSLTFSFWIVVRDQAEIFSHFYQVIVG